MPLTVKVVKREYGVCIVSPEGPVDSNTHAELEREMGSLLAEEPKIVILNMEGVDYVSSAGISVMIRTKRALAAKGGELVVVNLQPRVRKVFDVINALPAEQIFESEEELDRYLATIQRNL